ncbi:hypothetical protein D3C76_1454390 [compost metagenome]
MGRQQPQQRADDHAQGMNGDIALVILLADPPQARRQRFDTAGTPGQGNHVATAQHGMGQQRQFKRLAGNGVDKTPRAVAAGDQALDLLQGLARELSRGQDNVRLTGSKRKR